MKLLRVFLFSFASLLFFCCSSESPVETNLSLKNSVVARLNTLSSSEDYQKDVIYFLFVDRFFDGNASNNVGNNSAQYDPTKTNWKKYWGGDLAGLSQKLDYLKEMGITSVWVTPLVDGIDVPTNDGDAPYHGYWGKNFFDIDEHWGTWSDFDALVSKMHGDSYKMKLTLDYAPNHSNPNDEAEYGALYKSSYDEFGSVNATWKLTDYLLDTDGDWYHRLGGIGDTEWDDEYYCRYKNLFNLSDFNQDNSTTYNYLADALYMWLSRGVDCVRLDAVKHMNTSFTTQLVSDMKTRTGRDIYFFGEWMDAGAWATGLNAGGQSFANTSGCALLDFGYRSTIENVLKNSSTMRTLASYLRVRESYWDNPLKQVVFLDNHDMPRINTVLRSSGMSEAYAAARTDLGLAITMTVRGVPCVYYGTEQYAANFTMNSFGQSGSDPYNREMMPSFATDTNAFRIIRNLSALRQNNAALQKGTYTEKWVDDTLLAYERKSGGDVVVVVANKGSARSQIISHLNLPDGVYTNIIGAETVSVADGKATFSLAENAVIVLAANNAPVSQGINVHIYNNSIINWRDFYCYYWGSDGNSTSNVWPGELMAPSLEHWYSFLISGATFANMIFNNGVQQTVDLSRSGDGYFVPTGWNDGKLVGTWFDENPYLSQGKAGRLTICFTSGANSENVSFPGDFNNWNVAANTLSVAAGQSLSLAMDKAVTASTIGLGDDPLRLELKVVSNSSWDNQWTFSTWTKSKNISLADGGRQIAIDCAANDEVILSIDVAALSISATIQN